MPYGHMSIDDLARHIGMDARLVRKWAEKGKLPGQIVAGEWRFNRAAMLEFLQQHLHDFDEEHVRNLERAMRETPTSRDRLVASYLAHECIDMNLPARSRTSVLHELVVLASRGGQLYDPEGLTHALEEREAMGATALPGGIAFPHPRRPMPYAAAEPLIALARVPAGIPFGARDGNLTDLFVLICAPSDTVHLGLLARLSMMFSTSLPRVLRETEDATDVLELVLRTERELLERG